LLALGYSQETAQQVVDNAPSYAFHAPSADGCPDCTFGFTGRTAIAEVLTFGDAEKELLMGPDRSALNLRRLAIANGMVPLSHDGVNRAALGDTSLGEVRRVVA
jgi:type IV pilus assembly protein PilB